MKTTTSFFRNGFAAFIIVTLAGFGTHLQAAESGSAGCDVGSATEAKDAIWRALRSKRNDVVRCFVLNGYDINSTVLFNETLLDQAASDGNVELVEFLFEQGARINIAERPTIAAAVTGLGLDHEYFVDPDEEPFSSLEEHFEVLKILLDRGARLDEQYAPESTVYISLIMEFCDHEVTDRGAYNAFLDDLVARGTEPIIPAGRDEEIAKYMWPAIGIGYLDAKCVVNSFKSFGVEY